MANRTGIPGLSDRRLRSRVDRALVDDLRGACTIMAIRLAGWTLSALHARGPYQLRDLILGLAVHMVVIGLPISFSVRRFAT
jgi:hypothetical protein